MALRLKEPLTAYRIADRRHALLDGKGALLYGGRWNSPGSRVMYASLSQAGAMLEILASANIGRFPRTHVLVQITIPKGVPFDEVVATDVPGWNSADMRASRRYGDTWIHSGRSAFLIVPSVVAPKDRNVVIHLDHPDTKKTASSAPERVQWDERLLAHFHGGKRG